MHDEVCDILEPEILINLKMKQLCWPNQLIDSINSLGTNDRNSFDLMEIVNWIVVTTLCQ